jgi:hypothetical protein
VCSPAASPPNINERWLLDASSLELQTHRVAFLVLLCPLLGYWLPAQMLQVGLQVGLTAEGSARHLDHVPELLSAIVMVVAFMAPLGVLTYGAQREWRRLRAADASAGTGTRLLRAPRCTVWREGFLTPRSGR